MRSLPALQAAGFTCRWETVAGMAYLNIDFPENGLKECSIRLLIGYFSEPVAKKEQFIKSNTGFNNPDNEIEKLEAGIAHIDSLTERWNRSIADLKLINGDAEKFKLEWSYELNDRD